MDRVTDDFGLLGLMELQRISDQYGHNAKLTDVGLEDFFIALEPLYRATDDEKLRKDTHTAVRQIIVDAIYNDGKIQKLDYGAEFGSFINSYDNVFTLNYDTNLDKYRNDVVHLHGRFDVLAPEYDSKSEFCLSNPSECREAEMVSGFEHTYCDAIMEWNWLNKYGDWLNKEKLYGDDKFKSIPGQLDIVGMAPQNDEHIFITISNNSQVRLVNFYYFNKNERAEIRKHIKNHSITDKDVNRLWNRLK